MAVIDLKVKDVVATWPEIVARWKKKKGANDKHEEGQKKPLREVVKAGSDPKDKAGDSG